MTPELVQTLGKYLIAIAVITGCFVLLYTGDPTNTQPWTVIGLIIGWIVRDNAGTSATTNAVAVVKAAIPAAVPTP